MPWLTVCEFSRRLQFLSWASALGQTLEDLYWTRPQSISRKEQVDAALGAFCTTAGFHPDRLWGNPTKRIPCCSCSDWSGRATDGQLQAHCLGLDVPLHGRRYLLVPPCVYL
ncbi:hypothetical protein NEUTE1DRAFT_121566 [Neurospora tetrasperma FGSC 2508]|uniref:Uncharacterized protein n=1 Tax=Neurospora tetrasperma (strain FGSC 2508 / ATCC MYA-4615 / P0657) TaxID=510951 RepID=F8MIW1_NEUT8|nr:uncharacterized protein NEUTE1DRAFT_121566 [Neurospora tetrasperma FGSC 2508]EGO59858.1 hypothetical protein NEUTE1DRAFT_121566 [Neurospora tetrasperma FGSC 2508]EGZ74008.1 hypothetical protein NEUTE2DRAFT_109147 [Neurospora tetrasperma FGSC 2509]